VKNRLAIFERLHIDPNDVLYDNPFFQRKTLRHAGCQIDYLIQIRQKTQATESGAGNGNRTHGAGSSKPMKCGGRVRIGRILYVRSTTAGFSVIAIHVCRAPAIAAVTNDAKSAKAKAQ
jgi:hypothetical protein